MLSWNLYYLQSSSTTFVKHFISTVNEAQASDQSRNYFLAGYVNTTSAVNAIRFEMGGGSYNHDSGVIKLYGLVKHNNNSISAVTSMASLSTGAGL